MEEDPNKPAFVADFAAVSNLFLPYEGAEIQVVYHDVSSRCYVAIYRKTALFTIINRLEECQKGYCAVDLKWEAVCNLVKKTKSLLSRFDVDKKEDFWESHKLDDSVTLEFSNNDSRCSGSRRLRFLPSNPSPSKSESENVPYLTFSKGTDFHFISFLESNMDRMISDAERALDYKIAADDGEKVEGAIPILK